MHVLPQVAAAIAPVLARRGVAAVRVPAEISPAPELSAFLSRVSELSSSAATEYQIEGVSCCGQSSPSVYCTHTIPPLIAWVLLQLWDGLCTFEKVRDTHKDDHTR